MQVNREKHIGIDMLKEKMYKSACTNYVECILVEILEGINKRQNIDSMFSEISVITVLIGFWGSSLEWLLIIHGLFCSRVIFWGKQHSHPVALQE